MAKGFLSTTFRKCAKAGRRIKALGNGLVRIVEGAGMSLFMMEQRKLAPIKVSQTPTHRSPNGRRPG